jgi:hypothetical protein
MTQRKLSYIIYNLFGDEEHRIKKIINEYLTGKICKYAVAARFEIYPCISMEELRKNMKTLENIVAEARSEPKASVT